MANLKNLIVNGSARILGNLYATIFSDSVKLSGYTKGTEVLNVSNGDNLTAVVSAIETALSTIETSGGSGSSTEVSELSSTVSDLSTTVSDLSSTVSNLSTTVSNLSSTVQTNYNILAETRTILDIHTSNASNYQLLIDIMYDT